MDQEILEELGEFYKIIGDTTRLRILELLQKDELNVSEISSKLDMTASAISHQLQVLRYHDLVKTRRNGKEIYYSLKDEHINVIFKYGLEHILERKGL
ncbi:MAG: winged helix-turn-helix transcriptional regulator [Bacilli bacterium]|nr:winged helix-turn-helix transcriptional regulator [Bacilli bacterium]